MLLFSPEAKRGRMSPSELFALSFFLCACHAVVEDTLLFVVIGGDAFWILAPRILLAVTLTMLLARWGKKADRQGQ